MNTLFRYSALFLLMCLYLTSYAQSQAVSSGVSLSQIGMHGSGNTGQANPDMGGIMTHGVSQHSEDNIEGSPSQIDVAKQSIVYIQNEIISSIKNVKGENVYIGYDVTTSKPYGNVTVKNGAVLKVISSAETIIKNGFECEKGASLTVQ